MEEAGISINFKLYDENGGDYLVTMRGETADKWPEVLQERKKLVDWAAGKGLSVAAGRQSEARSTGNGAPKTNGGGNNTANSQFKEFDATQIIKTFDDDGNLRIKLKGKPFEKFGVPVYEEDFGILGMDVHELHTGPSPFAHRVRAILKDDGNPRKVVELMPSKIQQAIGNAIRAKFPQAKIVQNCRPDWLVSGAGERLELDFYLPWLRIAFEVQGRQHERFVKNFHGTREGFDAQLRRDVEKRRLCEDFGVRLYSVASLEEFQEAL
jgi:hypothetical protein